MRGASISFGKWFFWKMVQSSDLWETSSCPSIERWTHERDGIGQFGLCITPDHCQKKRLMTASASRGSKQLNTGLPKKATRRRFGLHWGCLGKAG